MARDGGHLANIEPVEAERIRISDPLAAKYLRRVVGAQEMLNKGERYCLWLLGADPSDVANSRELQRRLSAVREGRASSQAASTRAAAATPGLFVQRAQPTSSYLAVPSVSSESRTYLPCAFFGADVIATNLVFTISGASTLLFGVVSSKVFTVWHRSVSGRLKSDPRVSADITYNNFPWPTEEAATAGAIRSAAQSVLDAREAYPDASLAVLYGPNSMPPELLRAHQKLDAAVLKHFELPARADEADTLARLFEHYNVFLAPLKTD